MIFPSIVVLVDEVKPELHFITTMEVLFEFVIVFCRAVTSLAPQTLIALPPD